MRNVAAVSIGARCNGIEAGEVLGFCGRAVQAVRNVTRASDCCDADTVNTILDQP